MSAALDAPREEVVAGVIERVVFHNPENGFCVLRVRLPDRDEFATVVGALPLVREGEALRATGRWQSDPSWGWQFRATALAALPPTSEEGLVAYLSSGLIKGIGRSMAVRLVQAFGNRLFDVIDHQPERLHEVEGVGKKTAERIREAWNAQRKVHDIMLFLHGHGLSPLRAARIHEVYGEAAIDVVMRDPYRLARDVRGIGFTTADELAASLEVAKDSPQRLRAGLDHVLQQAASEGHCALPRSWLLERTVELLGVAEAAVEAALVERLGRGALVEERDGDRPLVFAPSTVEMERAVAERLAAIAALPAGLAIDEPERLLAEVEERLGLTLASEQREAVRDGWTRRLLVVTGGPGTGKTTLVRALLAGLPAELEVQLAAPTGRAARRLSETTGFPARTLHRLLEADPARGFARGPDRPLELDVLVVDEMSMVDLPLTHALLRALPEECSLILVGDADQLPSIGPGRVLADLLASPGLPSVRLSEIFRQAAESRIVTAAHAINVGRMPEAERGDELSDFYVIRADTTEDGARKIQRLVADRIPSRFDLDPIDAVQVLCPTNKGRLGTQSLNEELRALLNPDPAERLERKGVVYALGDKVMQLENDYEREISNGDLGRVCRIDRQNRVLTCRIDGREHDYAYDELDALAPAYAITVHKAQGSEYPAVVIPLMAQHGRMLRRNLLYTAITRARSLAVLVAEPRALEIAIRERPPARFGRLRDRLIDACERQSGRTSTEN